MADFTLAQIGGASGGGPSPQPGVPSPNPVTAVAEFGSGIASSLFQSMQEGQQKQAEVQTNEAVSRFMRQQMEIAEAVDRGDLTSQEGRMRMRANLSASLSNAGNPQLQKEFSDAHSKVIGTAGMGKVADEGTEQEQAFFKIQAEAMENGFVSLDMSPEQARQGTNNYIRLNQARLQNELAKEELAMAQAQLTYQRGLIGIQSDRVGLETSRLSLQEKRAEAASRRAVTEGADAYLPVFAKQLQDIQAQVTEGSLSPQEADAALRQTYNMVEGELRSSGASLSSTYLDNVLTPYERLYETARGTLTGQFSTEVFNEMRENVEAQLGLQLILDPDVAGVAVMSDLLGNAAGPILQVEGSGAARRAVEALEQNTFENIPYDFRGTNKREGIQGYLGVIENGTRRIASPNPMPNQQGVEDEIARNVNSLFQGVSQYGDSAEFQDVKPILDYLSGDIYADYITGKGKGALNKSYEAEAKDWMQRYFMDNIQPLIADEWRNATADIGVLPRGEARGGVGAQEVNVSEVIRPFFTGDGLRFVLSDDSLQNNPRVKRVVQNLNERVSPALRQFIRLGAHLEEHTDYERIYQANYADIFGDVGTGSASE